MIHNFLNIFLPQSCLVFFIILQLLLSVILSPRLYKHAKVVSCTGLAISGLLLTTVRFEPQTFGFHNCVMSDEYTLFFHLIILICGIFVTLLTTNLSKNLKQNAYTLQAIFLTAILGGMCVVSANDFLTLFISAELLSFPLYFLISSKTGYFSKEASFKYLITNAVSSGVFLFGVSYLYGLTSSINFTDIYEIMAAKNITIIHVAASIMVIAGLISKLAIFPFANWIIDVYKGCETSVLAFMSTIPKIALFGIFCRLLVFPLGNSFEVIFVICILALITATWANAYAIREKNVKAILACSSAANISYMVIVTSIISVYNLSAAIFYLICYAILDLAAFGFLNITEYNSKGFELEDFCGLFQQNKGLTLAYAVSIIGLAGFPVTSGFIAKIYLFSGIIRSGIVFLPFLIAILVLTVVSLYYYFKILTPLFKKTEGDNSKLITLPSQSFVVYWCCAITVLIGLYPDKLIALCKFIAYNI